MSSLATKRIMKDMLELRNNPIVGVSLTFVEDSDLFNIHGSLIVNDGLYEGLFLHVHIQLSHDYPNVAPLMFVDNRLLGCMPFDHRFHGHIHPDEKGKLSVCNGESSNTYQHEFIFHL
jgi:hypothetical protein